VAFGGFDVDPNPDDRDIALHAFIAKAGECQPAATRANRAAQTLATSNLLVRRDVLAGFAFDVGFRGWGYEDSEWAFRVASRHPIRHVDNPLRHLGLDATETLIAKYAGCGDNYWRLVNAHPRAARDFAALRVARLVKRLPLAPHQLGQAAAWVARDPARILPLPVRAAALKLARASAIAARMPNDHVQAAHAAEGLA
jgi:hypothetical protein